MLQPSLSLLHLSHIRMTITMTSRSLGWPPGDQITLSSQFYLIFISYISLSALCWIYLYILYLTDKQNQFPPQEQEYHYHSLSLHYRNVLKVYLSMLRTTSMLEEAMNPPVLAIISTLQTKFPAYHWNKTFFCTSKDKTFLTGCLILTRQII